MPTIISRTATAPIQKIQEIGTVKSTSKAIDTDWFASNQSPTNAPAIHRIYMMVEGADTVVRLELDDGTNTDLICNFNGGTALSQDTLYAFDVVLPEGYSYNIQHATTTQKVNCWIVEIGVA